MNNAQKNNLRKLSFLGFSQHDKSRNNTGNNDGEVKLDEECAKVFAMEGGISTGFNIHKFHDSPTPSGQPRQIDEEINHHREKSYPHTHVPLKIAPKSMRRRQPPPVNIPSAAAAIPDTSPYPAVTTPTTPLSQQEEDSTTVPLSSITLPEESDTAANSSESECVFSEPCNDSVEKRVQFLGQSDNGDIPNGKEKEKKKRKHFHHHSKFRKYSLPTEVSDPVSSSRRRHHHHHHHHHHEKNEVTFNEKRRVSTQPEDLPLKDADRDQLDSHRSDDSKALRRPKISRPSNASMVYVGKNDVGELHFSSNKKYDHSPHALFVELDELHTSVEENEWKEKARWIKYEEDVEEGIDRWGKPHVASLSFHSLLNLRKCLEDGLVLLDMEERDLPAIAYRVTEDLYREDLIREEDKAKLMRTLLLRHRHVNESHDKGFRFTKKHSYASLQNLYDLERRKISMPFDISKNGHLDAESKLLGDNNHVAVEIRGEDTYSASSEDVRKAQNESILKKIPPGAQASSVLVGEVDFLEQPAISFIRLAEGIVIPSLVEVNLPCRFIFILLGPKRANLDYREVGRSISTLMANQQFLNIAFGAYDRKALLSAINEFLDDSIVLPPGNWERKALLPIEELKAKSEQIRKRKENALKKAAEAQGITKPLLGTGEGDEKKPPYNPLERTRRPWGGLINDLKRRYPYYMSDVKDGLNAQCAAASIFMYFAALSGAVAFGGLLSNKTDNSIGTSETLMCTSISGILFALLSGQPLVIVGTTGPLLLFDESLYQFCTSSGIDFLQTRIFIGLWLAFIGLFVACLEGSMLVKLFTRFTEDIFSALIVLLYILESVTKLILLFHKHPLLTNYCEFEEITVPANDSAIFRDLRNETGYQDSQMLNIIQYRPLPMTDSYGPINQPNTALFCTVLSLGTFIIAYYLKMFRNSQFLGRNARRALGDFGVPIAIVTMVFVDYIVPQTYTEKLSVPEGLSPSNPERRGWFIPPTGLPVWVMFASVIPAMLVYILLFMETHITELIIDKKERKLKKGSGFHLDIVLICLCNILSGTFGLPWVCAATVRSITHVSALTVMSRTHAPGEKPHLIEVKEQRISALAVATLIGLSVLMAPLLRLIPMAVLFGVFLYMGAASIDGIQFFDRMKLFFMPVKHHPQASYVRRVKTHKMHIFTGVQLACLIFLWIVKSTKAALAFPFFLVLMVPLRAQLTHFFSTRELRALDGDQPDADDDEPDFYAEAPLPG
ncbi:anion exchange protein 3 isoform X2 [Coccinella septempunctata]|uniref:anion exchange protein 3 isoform X2 n=1 Tax=Coccinella septempunctata TaxID=41139 RepID=UPI001D07D688|nr:anion exchange protein 3 isoform X2 [Coccinella septempunctata]XP_044763399.1 anion exchange protein 3 isoform X2 [Coccinella septempunctata]